MNVGAMLRLSVADRVLGAHRIYRFFAALVPDFIEPLANQRCISRHAKHLVFLFG
jgi:hypothetical protein